jgi:hypothetical protein
MDAVVGLSAGCLRVRRRSWLSAQRESCLAVWAVDTTSAITRVRQQLRWLARLECREGGRRCRTTRVMVLQYCSIVLYIKCESASPELHDSSTSQSVRAPPPSPICGAQHPPTTTQHTAQHSKYCNCTALQRVHSAPRSCTPELHYPSVPWGLRTTTQSARGPPHASVQGITVSDCTTATASQPASRYGVGRSVRAYMRHGCRRHGTWAESVGSIDNTP